MTGEGLDIPGVGVMTDIFADAAEAMAEALGAPDQVFITIPHPISSATDAELDQLAREAAARCTALLTSE